MKEVALKINEIFYSLQGESLSVGKPTTFVRTATCNMRCRWCDTRYAFWEGKRFTLDQILEAVSKYPARYVCVTGGEPLGQKGVYPLLSSLVARGYRVSLETGGGFSVKDVPEEVVRVIDVKCPGSGETDNMCWENLQLVRPQDQLKFVIASKEDFDWAKTLIEKEHLDEKCTVLISPVFGEVEKKELAEWVLETPLALTFQTQLHKEVWGEVRGT